MSNQAKLPNMCRFGVNFNFNFNIMASPAEFLLYIQHISCPAQHLADRAHTSTYLLRMSRHLFSLQPGSVEVLCGASRPPPVEMSLSTMNRGSPFTYLAI